jgi:sec-independent protein translocase protein TatC
MTTATEPPPSKQRADYDPDEFRMTIGEHLEELRKRLIFGLLGFAAALIFFMFPSVGERVVTIFCAPLVHAMQEHKIPPQLIVIGVTEGFMTYLQICVVCALVIAGPWLIYQLWLFVAAGLYPTERKTITKYIPLSIGLLVAGVLFVYFAVLPMTLNFFLSFNSGFPLPHDLATHKIVQNAPLPVKFPILEGDPANPPPGSIWFNAPESQLKFKLPDELRTVPFGSVNLLDSKFTLDDYIGFVLTMMLVFGLAFQLPLVLMALVRVGLVEIDFLKKQRRIVYFIMTIVAAVIAPGDVVTTMVALLIPMFLLYEFGIWLAIWAQKQRARAEREAERT